MVLTGSASGLSRSSENRRHLASKWGLIGLGQCLRKEVSSSGMRVVISAPGVVLSPLTRDNPATPGPVDASEPRLPEDVARAVVCVIPAGALSAWASSRSGHSTSRN